jgi:hypothetical protein
MYGNVCGLTSKAPAFESVCPTYIWDVNTQPETAFVVDENPDAQHEDARKDMLYGALWCVGGTIATMADIGYIFWGAIIFGAVQFFKGLANSK